MAGLPHLEGPKWKTTDLIISSVSFSAEKDHRMWLGDALDRISSRYLFLYFTFFSFRFTPMCFYLLEEKKKKKIVKGQTIVVL